MRAKRDSGDNSAIKLETAIKGGNNHTYVVAPFLCALHNPAVPFTQVVIYRKQWPLYTAVNHAIHAYTCTLHLKKFQLRWITHDVIQAEGWLLDGGLGCGGVEGCGCVKGGGGLEEIIARESSGGGERCRVAGEGGGEGQPIHFVLIEEVTLLFASSKAVRD